jgi:hypothetical protein
MEDCAGGKTRRVPILGEAEKADHLGSHLETGCILGTACVALSAPYE